MTGTQLYRNWIAVMTVSGCDSPARSRAASKPAPDITQPSTAVPSPGPSFCAAEIAALPMPTGSIPLFNLLYVIVSATMPIAIPPLMPRPNPFSALKNMIVGRLSAKSPNPRNPTVRIPRPAT